MISVLWKKIRGVKRPRLLTAQIALILVAAFLEVACNQNYRPIVQPVLPPPPNPAAFHYVISVTTNGSDVFDSATGLCSPSGLKPPCDQNPGSASRIDVSGDTYAGAFNTGVGPVHAALTPSGSKLYVANLREDTVSVNNVGTPTQVGTISLAAGSQPVFVHSAENANMYTANYGNSTVAQINTTSDAVIRTLTVGSLPVALAEIPNGQKLYVANQGPGTVSSVNITGFNVGTTIPVGPTPVWAVARADSARVYVLDNNGTIYEINTLTDIATAVPTSMGAGANFMALDPHIQRLYVTNPSNGKVGIFDVSGTVNQLAVIDLGQGANAPCPGGCSPVSVTGIGDGSRAYVASYQLTPCGGAPCVSTQVSVINTGTNTVSKVIPLTTVPVDMTNPADCGPATGPVSAAPWTPGVARFRAFTVSSGGGSTSNFKVYVSQCDAGSIAVIDTSAVSTGTNPHPADVFTASLTAPLSSFPSLQASISTVTVATGMATYTFAPTNLGLQVGMKIFVTGMADSGNNGFFPIAALDTVNSTFTVANASAVAATSQAGSGTVLPPQNPVFVVAGP